jgi:pimeloyl-ACP methyl ester carboxylesterase
VVANPAQDSTVRKLAEMLRGPAAADAVEMLVNAQVGPLDPVGLKEEYRGTALSTTPHVLAAVQEAFLDWDGEAAVAGVRVPALFTFSRAPVRYADLDRIKELCPQAVIGHTVGAGHFENRSVPDQLNSMIKRFLEVYIPS